MSTIPDYAFAYCNGLSGPLDIPNSVTSIGTNSFYSCSGLTGDLIIPDSVTEIGEFSFGYCSGFTGSLIISSQLSKIADYAFDNCSGFTGELFIPNSVTSIGKRSFYSCNHFSGALTIPTSVTSIGNEAFKYCSGLTGDLIIPNSVYSIGNGAFYDCSGFTGRLSISNNVTNIGNETFMHCIGLTGSLIIPNNVTGIGNSAFYECRKLNGSLIIPDSVTNIGDSAFQNCDGFTGNLSISSSIDSIGKSAFRDCRGFTGNILIPASLTFVSDDAFEGINHATFSATPGTYSYDWANRHYLINTELVSGINWNQDYTFTSSSQTSTRKGTQITPSYFEKSLYMSNQAGGFFELDVNTACDIQLYINNTHETSKEFVMHFTIFDKNGSRKSSSSVLISKSNDIQTVNFDGLSTGDIICWWDDDNSGRSYTYRGNYYLWVQPYNIVNMPYGEDIPIPEHATTYTIQSAGDRNSAAAAVIPGDIFGKSIYLTNQVGGFFSFIVTKEGKLNLYIDASETTADFIMRFCGNSPELQQTVNIYKMQGIQCVSFNNVHIGDRIVWWDDDGTGQAHTYRGSYYLIIDQIESEVTEEDFREWAAKVLTEYYFLYSCHDNYEYRAHPVEFTNFDSIRDLIFKHTTDIAHIDTSIRGTLDGLFRDYYLMSMYKLHYDLNGYKDTYYYIQTDDETDSEYEARMMPFFKKLLLDTLTQKAEIDSASFSNLEKNSKGQFSLVYDESSGVTRMIVDPDGLMSNLGEMGDVAVQEAWSDFAIQAISLAYDVAKAYIDIHTNPFADANSYLENAKEAIKKAIESLIQTISDTHFTNKMNQLENNIYTIILAEIANAKLQDYSRIIDYLENIYAGKDDTFIEYNTNWLFKKAVRQLIDYIDSTKYYCSEQYAKEVLAEYYQDGIVLKHILDSNEITEIILAQLVNQTINCIVSPIKTFADECEKDGMHIFAGIVNSCCDIVTGLLSEVVSNEINNLLGKESLEGMDSQEARVIIIQKALENTISSLKEYETSDYNFYNSSESALADWYDICKTLISDM